MSTRTRLAPASVITNGDMSAASITSAATILSSMTCASYSLSWTGSTPVGTASVQVSNDYAINGNIVLNAGTWTTIYLNVNGTPATTIAITGNTGNGFIDIEKTAAYAIRLVYTKGSGTGTLNAIITGKVS